MDEASEDDTLHSPKGTIFSADAASEVTDGSYQRDIDRKDSDGSEESDDDVDADIEEDAANDDYYVNPMQKLQKAALELAGISAHRAFAIDRINVHQKFDEYTIGRLTEIFYEKVYSDPDEWFRSMFTSPLSEAAGNLGDYIIQRIGGPAYYRLISCA